MKIKFLTSAVFKSDYPQGRKKEVMIAGRSNAGKSSFINSLAEKKVAHTSQQPGKTRLLNFFEVGDKYLMVDVPGYGYAARSGQEQVSWQEMIEGYMAHRKNFVGLVLIMDIRRDWQQEEQLMAQWAAQRGLPLVVVLNKSDKVGRNERNKRLRAIEKASQAESVFCASSVSGEGVKEVEEYVFRNWIH